MNQLHELTGRILSDDAVKQVLKSSVNDEEFVAALVAHGKKLGYDVSADEVSAQMDADREVASRMDPTKFEAVAGTMLGARLSGGHTSGASC